MARKHYHILIADDDPIVLESLGQSLQRVAKKNRDRLSLFSATTGLQALKILREKRIDVLFLDYRFGAGMSGDEIIDRIIDPFGNKLIFLVSGQPPKDLRNVLTKRHKQQGVRFRFLRKPVDELIVLDTYLEIENFFADRPHPFPLAYAIDNLWASSLPQARLIAIKDVLDVVIRFSVAVFMVNLRRFADAFPDEFNSCTGRSARFRITAELTMGAWLNWLSASLSVLKQFNQNGFMPELLALFSKENHLAWIKRFKYSVRDSQIGHGFLREDEWYTRQIDEYWNHVRDLISSLQFTTQYMMFAREQVEFSEGDKAYFYKVRRLMGAEIRPGLLDLQTDEKIPKDEVCIYTPTNEIVSLSPFFAYFYCDACSFKHLFYLDKVSEKQIRYAGFCNHRFATDIGIREFYNAYMPIISKLT